MTSRFMHKLAAGAFACLLASSASAALVPIGPWGFIAGSGLITFSEFPLDTVNPHYTPANYGGAASSPDVGFGAYFQGQGVGTCQNGGPLPCVDGTPAGPLRLDLTAEPHAILKMDGANPTSPVISGIPVFGGPVAVWFSTDQAGVGFDAGYFDNAYQTSISVYGRDGTLLGSTTNSERLGLEFFGFATDDGSERIAGVLISAVGDEGAGFAIDNLRFGGAGQVTLVPEPATWLLLGMGLAVVGVARSKA